MFKATFNTIL